jgi:hypothetical protein
MIVSTAAGSELVDVQDGDVVAGVVGQVACHGRGCGHVTGRVA